MGIGRRYASAMTAEDASGDEVLPLRERMPVYLRLFAVGLAGGGVVGVLAGLLAGTGPVLGIGYTLIAIGTLLLLIGGARGGGYSNLGLGAVEALVHGRNRTDDDYVHNEALRRGAVNQRRDPMERLRKGLRPPANPTAFWQTIAGLVYVGVGAGLTLTFP
jgi:hypothetical protein